MPEPIPDPIREYSSTIQRLQYVCSDLRDAIETIKKATPYLVDWPQFQDVKSGQPPAELAKWPDSKRLSELLLKFEATKKALTDAFCATDALDRNALRDPKEVIAAAIAAR